MTARPPRPRVYALTVSAAFVLALAAPAWAEAPRLALPLDCILGESCFIQNYVDADPGPDSSDFTCGGLSYDGHKGTDFALPTMRAMAMGVPVRAAAPGVVRAVRDGMADTGLDGTPPAALEGKDCGNGVVIDHGDGWETQYCHLKQGSIAVAQGNRVAAGAALGEVGFSGRTAFPHLHLSVRAGGAVVDPFNTDGAITCGQDDEPEDDLWAEPIGYAAGGLISVGIATAVPAFDDIKSGAAIRDALPLDAPALVGWAQVFGGRAGDGVEIILIEPAGAVLYSHTASLDKPQARLFRAAGRKAPATGWLPGNWTVTARLIRDGMTISALRAIVRIDN